MTYVNILYDGLYDDVDIIGVPDNIVNQIKCLAQEYLDWIPPQSDPDAWVIINCRKCLSKGAHGFTKWLNEKYSLKDKAFVASQNVPFCPLYQTVEF